MKAWLFLIAASLALDAQPPAPPPQPARGYMSQIASGGGWKTTVTLFNPTTSPNQVQLLFVADDGSRLTLPFVLSQGGVTLSGTGTEIARTMQALSTMTVETELPATAATVAGWVEAVSNRPVSGSAIFRLRSPDGTRSVEAVSPLEYSPASAVIVPFDNRDGTATGIALVNPSGQPFDIILRARNENGIQFEQRSFNLPARGHTAFLLTERFPSLANRQGTAEFFSTSLPITGLGLRATASGGLTSIPVLLGPRLPDEP